MKETYLCLSLLVFFFNSCRCVEAQVHTEWLTHSGNPERTAWQKNETQITKENVKSFQMLWKLQLDNQTHSLHSLTVPLIAGAPTRDLAVVVGTGNNLYMLDADLGRIVWKKHFEYQGDVPEDSNSTWLCPGGAIATPVIWSSIANLGPTPVAPSATGRGDSPASTTTLTTAPVIPRGRTILMATGDGLLHQLSLNSGQETSQPYPFVPPNSKPYSLNLVDDTVYAITGQFCGGRPNAVYALDLSSLDKKVSVFQPYPVGFGAGLWGLAGTTIGSDGTVYTQTGDGIFDPSKRLYGTSFLALTPKTLELKDYYTPTNAEWLTKRDLDLNSSPVVFNYKGRELVVGATGKEGRLVLMDAKSLGGPDHRTPLYRTSLIGNYDVSFEAKGIWGSLASWEDTDGTRWVVAPMWGPIHPDFRFPINNGEAQDGSLVAFKLEEEGGQLVLSPVWVSRNLIAPTPPVIANGLVFALSSGENVTQTLGGEQRAKLSTHATLYAFDAQTGKELYSSGNEITSFTHFGALAVASGRVFFSTWDNTVYAFGIYLEH